MANKRLKLGLLLSIIAIVVCVGLALVMAQPIFGLDFSDGYLLRIDLKKDFDTTDVLSRLQPMKKDLGDLHVSATGSGAVAQALIYVQKIDDTTQSEMMSALEKEYPDATLRGVAEIKTQHSKLALLPYALFLLLGIVLVAVYFSLRKVLSAGIGYIIAALLSIVLSLAVCIVCAIPVNVSNLVSAGAGSLVSLTLFYTLLSQHIDLEEEGVQLGAKTKNAVTVGLILTLAFCIALFVVGGIGLRAVAASICIGLLVGILEAAFVALPFTVLYKDKFKGKAKAKKRVKI